jgi:hypothetical protein
MPRSVLLALACLASACGAPGGAADPGDAGATTDAARIAPDLPDGAGCGSNVDGSESDQRHGTACLCCHSDEFGVAGSVDPAGSPVARVVVTGSDGDVADMYVNQFSNFFRHFPLATPVSAVVYAPDGAARAMQELAPSADCNACHFAGGPVPPIVGP